MSGQTIQLSAEWLRSSGVELLGSGLGSSSLASILTSIGEMFGAYERAGFRVETEAVPLEDVEKAWGRTESGRWTVLVTRK